VIKNILAIMLAAVFLLVSTGLVMADGNWRKGKYLYRKNCRTCHKAGGSAKDLSPATYKQAKWEELFNKGTIPCRDKWSKLSDKAVADMYSYLHGHAADSPTPAKCK
jgi:mono/diheme cytochrome c family protein